jgi:hypothetical protein
VGVDNTGVRSILIDFLRLCDRVPPIKPEGGRHNHDTWIGRPLIKTERQAQSSSGFNSCPISAHYRTYFIQDKRGGFNAEDDDKAPPLRDDESCDSTPQRRL